MSHHTAPPEKDLPGPWSQRLCLQTEDNLDKRFQDEVEENQEHSGVHQLSQEHLSEKIVCTIADLLVLCRKDHSQLRRNPHFFQLRKIILMGIN
jgi:hypothetical protein